MVWPKVTKSQFSASTPDKREIARRAGAKSSTIIRRDPAAAGRRSWAKRSDALKAQHLAALEAKADRAKGGQVMAELCKNPQFLLERAITRLRSEAAERGEPLPSYYRIVPYEIASVRRPGRMRRKRKQLSNSAD
jgi:hypothetical protein